MKQAKLQFPLSLVFVLFCGFVPWECDRSIRRKDEIANKSHIFFLVSNDFIQQIQFQQIATNALHFRQRTKEIPQIILVSLFVWFVSFFVYAIRSLSLFLTLSLSPTIFITQFHFVICDNYFFCTLHQTKRKRHK